MQNKKLQKKMLFGKNRNYNPCFHLNSKIIYDFFLFSKLFFLFIK